MDSSQIEDTFAHLSREPTGKRSMSLSQQAAADDSMPPDNNMPPPPLPHNANTQSQSQTLQQESASQNPRLQQDERLTEKSFNFDEGLEEEDDENGPGGAYGLPRPGQYTAEELEQFTRSDIDHGFIEHEEDDDDDLDAHYPRLPKDPNPYREDAPPADPDPPDRGRTTRSSHLMSPARSAHSMRSLREKEPRSLSRHTTTQRAGRKIINEKQGTRAREGDTLDLTEFIPRDWNQRGDQLFRHKTARFKDITDSQDLLTRVQDNPEAWLDTLDNAALLWNDQPEILAKVEADASAKVTQAHLEVRSVMARNKELKEEMVGLSSQLATLEVQAGKDKETMRSAQEKLRKYRTQRQQDKADLQRLNTENEFLRNKVTEFEQPRQTRDRTRTPKRKNAAEALQEELSRNSDDEEEDVVFHTARQHNRTVHTTTHTQRVPAKTSDNPPVRQRLERERTQARDNSPSRDRERDRERDRGRRRHRSQSSESRSRSRGKGPKMPDSFAADSKDPKDPPFREWKQKMQYALENSKKSERRKVQEVLQNTTKNAWNHLQPMIDTFRTFDDALQHMEDRWGDQHQKYTKRAEFAKLKQEPNESFAAFWPRFIHYQPFLSYGKDQEEMMDQLRDKLSSDFERSIRSKFFATLDDMKAELRVFDVNTTRQKLLHGNTQTGGRGGGNSNNGGGRGGNTANKDSSTSTQGGYTRKTMHELNDTVKNDYNWPLTVNGKKYDFQLITPELYDKQDKCFACREPGHKRNKPACPLYAHRKRQGIRKDGPTNAATTIDVNSNGPPTYEQQLKE